MQRHASAAYAVVVCLSLCPSIHPSVRPSIHHKPSLYQSG